MSTELFPGSMGSSASLPGLAFSVHKRPKFATNVHQAQSGRSARNAGRQYPLWEFEFTYEFLEDSSGAESSLKSLMGFFLSRQGGFDTFLIKDPDDYVVTDGALGTADGLLTEFTFKRTMGSFAEKVGQLDNGQPIIVYRSPSEATTVPASPGPYTRTVAHAAAFVEDLGVTKGGVAMTKVASAPAAGQYAVDIGTGVYTFAAADHDQAIIISYRYEIDPADYTIAMPNRLIFAVAPGAGRISADFEFYFNCRFLEDQADFEKFAHELWELQSITLETVPQ